MDKKSGKQADLLQFLLENPAPVALSEVKRKLGCSAQTVKALTDKGLIEIQEVRVDRDPLSARNINLSFPLSLNFCSGSSSFKLFAPV